MDYEQCCKKNDNFFKKMTIEKKDKKPTSDIFE